MSGDPFKNTPSGLESPAAIHHPVVPSADELVPRPRALFALTSGDVTVEDHLGTSITYPVTLGLLIPFRAHKITAATATIVAWL